MSGREKGGPCEKSFRIEGEGRTSLIQKEEKNKGKGRTKEKFLEEDSRKSLLTRKIREETRRKISIW